MCFCSHIWSYTDKNKTMKLDHGECGTSEQSKTCICSVTLFYIYAMQGSNWYWVRKCRHTLLQLNGLIWRTNFLRNSNSLIKCQPKNISFLTRIIVSFSWNTKHLNRAELLCFCPFFHRHVNYNSWPPYSKTSHPLEVGMLISSLVQLCKYGYFVKV